MLELRKAAANSTSQVFVQRAVSRLENHLSDERTSGAWQKATTDFARLAETQGYSPNLSWTEPDDVVYWRGRLFVFLADLEQCCLKAQARFDDATARNFGLAIEGKCKTSSATICRILVPEDDTDAQYRMIPSTGVKMTVVVDPLPVVLVKNRVAWWLLKHVVRNRVPAWD